MIKYSETIFSNYVKKNLSESNFSSGFSPNDLIGIYYQKLEPFNDFRNAQIINIFVSEGQTVMEGKILAEITFGGGTLKVLAQKSGIVHILKQTGAIINIGDNLFMIYHEKKVNFMDSIEFEKFRKKLIFNSVTLKILIAFICIHFLLTLGILQLSETLGGIVFLFFLIIKVIIVFFLFFIKKLFDEPLYMQEYYSNHGYNLSFVMPCLFWSIFTNIIYIGLEVKIIEVLIPFNF